MDLNEAVKQILNGLNELDEFLQKAYESSVIHKNKMKKYHDKKIEKRKFAIRDFVVLLSFRLRLFWGKLKSKYVRPFMITKVFPRRAVELENKGGARFTVNGQRIKIYLGHEESVHDVVESYRLDYF
nr:uncharacterized protein LOC101263569 [Solanum lycopersicum]